MYSKELLPKVEAIAKPTYKKIKKWCHGWPHVINVVKAAEKIAKMEGVDPVLCQIAAYCHDLGRLEEEEKALTNFKPGAPSQHAIMSVAPTQALLKRIGVTGKDADDIVEAVGIHNIKKYEGDNKIALILQDADRADGFGKLAILRFANFNCEIDLPEPKGEKDVEQMLVEVKNILREDKAKRQRMIETLNYAFGWCDELANTKSLKKYIAENFEYNKRLLDELNSLDYA